jgi:hypothetical protein
MGNKVNNLLHQLAKTRCGHGRFDTLPDRFFNLNCSFISSSFFGCRSFCYAQPCVAAQKNLECEFEIQPEQSPPLFPRLAFNVNVVFVYPLTVLYHGLSHQIVHFTSSSCG